MAVTFGNNAFDNSTISPVSYNNDGNFLLVGIDSTTNNITAVTYNGVAMTQVGSPQYHTVYTRYLTVWSLLNPTTGVNNIAITGGSNSYLNIQSVSGVNQGTPYTGLNISSGTSTTPAIAVTTTINNAYVYAFSLSGGTATAGANTTMVINNSGASLFTFRSTAVITPPASFTINENCANQEYAMKAFGINPVVASTANASFLLTIV
jgi:hypothetical protein